MPESRLGRTWWVRLPAVRRLIALALVAAVAVVTGCGGGDGASVEEQGRDAVDQFAAAVRDSDEELCASLVAPGGNIADQVKAAERVKPGVAKEITGVDLGACGLGNAANDIAALTIPKVVVTGNTATVAFENSTATFRLVKDGDEWKIEAIKPAEPSKSRITFSRCDDAKQGGGVGIWVSGMGCSGVTTEFLLSLPTRNFGTKNPGALSPDERQVVTRRHNGWKCLALLEGNFGPVHHICRRGGRIVSFYIG
jgi:hypothetical protein